jgi:hypothetical protein
MFDLVDIVFNQNPLAYLDGARAIQGSLAP